MNKIIYATVIYRCDNFDVFIDDYLNSVFNQTNQNFDLLIISDGVDIAKIKSRVGSHNFNQKNIHYDINFKNHSPLKLRERIIEIAYNLDANYLIFSDFDENVAPNRVEEIIKNIHSYEFVFNDFFIVNNELKPLREKSFFQMRSIPDEIVDWNEVKSFNFIGFGSLAINLALYDYRKLLCPENIKALDWFIVTKVLLEGGKGKKVNRTFANYRQHNNSFVGFDFYLNQERLLQGIEVKENHYRYFSKYNKKYQDFYSGILDLKKYINRIGKDEYIRIVNSKFNTENFFWWENIKLIDEIV